MALTATLELETHPDGTVGVNAIVTGNWERLDEIFDPALAASDSAYEAFWRAVVRESDPTTHGATITWEPENGKPGWKAGFSTVTHATALTLDAHAGRIQEVDITGTTNFQSLDNQGPGDHIIVILRGDGSTRNLSFPSGWVWMEASEPSNIAANKTAWLELISSGTADADVVAYYKVES